MKTESNGMVAESKQEVILWTEQDIRRWLGISKSTFWRLLEKPDFPKRLDKVRRWRRCDIEKYFLG